MNEVDPLPPAAPAHAAVAFIGGGNMASALIGGLVDAGRAPASIFVVEPAAGQRESLAQRFGVAPLAAADARLAQAGLVVWAVKPQQFRDAAAPCRPHVGAALQLSVMAGVRSRTIADASGSERVVRAMPNTPALIGAGIAGLYARPAVGGNERALVESVLAPTGQLLWVDREADLDAVTALSGSGPAYVYYFLEAMIEAGVGMGLGADAARRLALQTFAGAAALAARSDEPPERLRDRVTSKGGTTEAALGVLEVEGVKAAFVRAMQAARRRAEELGAG